MSETQASFTVPQLIVVLIIGFLVIRWIFFSSSAPNQSSGGHAAGRSRVTQAQVDQVAQMFPQFSAREIMWDLQRNGGSVQATTERILSGRGLDMPPPSFQPQLSRNSPASGPGRPNSARPNQSPSHPDLITRYKLQDKISDASSSDVGSDANDPHKRPAWSQNKAERQVLLQKRREEMILAARRKLEEKDRAAKSS